MDTIRPESSTIRRLNCQIIAQDAECEAIITEMRSVVKFLNNFGFLSFGRDFVLCGNHSFSLQMVSTSCELTSGSIVSCCESGCMADAYSLLRKYRDDLFFYLYIVVYDTCKKLGVNIQKTIQMEENIEKWISNDLSDLHIGTVLQAIGQSPWAKEAVQKYQLKSYLDKIGDRLNNYVHSNGVSFYNRNVNAYQEKSLQRQMAALLQDLRFITITFLFLLTLCSPLSIMSTDYVDCLDCNTTPPEGSQYWVAPFVATFFKDNLTLINKNCIDYLRENTPMIFDAEM